MEVLLSWYQGFMEISKTNPIMSGVLGVYLIGVFTWLFRHIPGRIWTAIVTGSLRHLDISSHTGAGYNQNFYHFSAWIEEAGIPLFSRHKQLLWRYDNKASGWDSCVDPGYGKHYFFYKGRLFWFTKGRLENQQGTGENTKEELRVTGLFISEKLLRQLIAEFAERRETKPDRTWIYRVYGDQCNPSIAPPRKLNTIAINQNLLKSIMAKIDTFLVSESWYALRGIPYKLGIEITGPTGTGKTSLIRALATHYKRDLYVIDISNLSSAYQLQERLLEIRNGAFVLFEDYDSEKSLWKRERDEKGNAINHSSPTILSEDFRGMTLTGFLNAIDGIVPLNNLVLFYTTNNPELIDDAVRRKGRMDCSFEMGLLEHEDILAFIKGVFPSINTSKTFYPIKGSELSALLIDHADDPDAFINAIPGSVGKGCIDRDRVIGNGGISICGHVHSSGVEVDSATTADDGTQLEIISTSLVYESNKNGHWYSEEQVNPHWVKPKSGGSDDKTTGT